MLPSSLPSEMLDLARTTFLKKVAELSGSAQAEVNMRQAKLTPFPALIKPVPTARSFLLSSRLTL